jgi:TRAP transporter TAXI family solute receptor
MGIVSRATRALGLAAGMLALTGCHFRTAEPAKRPVLRLSYNGERSRFFEALVDAYRRDLPEVDLEPVPLGATTVGEAINSGTVDVGVSSADVTYAQYTGKLDGKSAPLSRLRAVAMLWMTPLQLIVRQDSRIRGIADLPHQGRVGIARADTIARLALSALGIEPSVRANLNEAGDGLSDGTLDAIVFARGLAWSPDAVGAVRVAIRVVPLDGERVERIRELDPFYQPAAIAQGTYPGQPNAVRTFGVQAILICRSDLTEQLVYELTKYFFEYASSPDHPPMPPIDMELAPATPIPLHAGAARYYRERELFQ